MADFRYNESSISTHGSIRQIGREPNKTKAAHHMRTTLTTALAVLTAIPLAFLSAAPATAAPGDTIAAFSTTPNPDGSNTVTGTFTSTQPGYFPFYCGFAEDDSGDGLPGGEILNADVDVADPQDAVLTISDTSVPDGTYTIAWFCYTRTIDSNQYRQLVDGTPGFGALFGEGQMTSEPVTLTVGSAAPSCTGSVCLPTGSAFGF
ncbi:hypothetical protein BH92_24555 [Rhodococcoides fascians A21d2]|uniref:hypothetical protein n=1 Tax=Nocardiaceae TaxID=85025 RepID=UPI00056AB934|nr:MULTISPECIES: hypothetical protein [Rhodococcus]OZE80535.1 hypothetical protein CH305_13420 [Rhodococcus sp. 15-649-2-2]QII02616.1 hypothetical protein BH92_24555 [Rhodococcus fascians A21d2]